MITIDYFSDVLCIWAYGGQIRLETLIEPDDRDRVVSTLLSWLTSPPKPDDKD